MSRSNLTPQLRTRLNRQERLVGLFVLLAGLLLLSAVVLYLRQVAKMKGWFLVRAPYFTFVDSAAGIREGDKVKLMGFDVGEIVEIEPMEPFAPWNVYVAFTVHKPYEGYVWSDSRARIAAGDLLGNRGIELTKGGAGGTPTYLFYEVVDMPLTNALALREPHNWKFGREIASADPDQPLTRLYEPVTRSALTQLQSLGTHEVRLFNTDQLHARIMAMYDYKAGAYVPFGRDSKGFFILPDEAPALADRLEDVMTQLEAALPQFLGLTNEVRGLFADATNLAHQAGALLADTRPVVTNLTLLTARLNEPDDALGRWLLSEAVRDELGATLISARRSLTAAQSTAHTADTNLTLLSRELLRSLEHLALITSNLNAQVQGNAFILEDISTLVRDTDDLMQGLRRHWLLKGAFQDPEPDPDPLQPTLAPVPE